MDTESLLPPEKLQNFTLGWGFFLSGKSSSNGEQQMCKQVLSNSPFSKM